ncbi:hypothetical protein [Xanthomonas sp. LMG 12461]|uniref:hypothetical protein n=1 Tax=Xanthomonas sp. LMG 12461 TaxID=2014543 RepID=UPI00126473D6|nr:hypothetical protein [Xanthomonas sp. LMG 12461]KAB7765387.1 hypothetical protein CEK68_11875 [Xanthomonas sp. LMG 12461]
MNIIISLIEFNPRRDNFVTVNGFDVHLSGANLTGSEKQIAWAEKIIINAARAIADGRFCKLPSLPTIEQAEKEIATINAFFAQHMSKLAGTKAADWIDLRDHGWEAFSVMLQKAT